MTHAIDVDGLRKSYDGVDAVADLSFYVEEGEVLAVLGPNGAGKTTTIEILEGYRPRDGGTVRVLGVDPGSGAAELRARIGIVLQECGVDAYLSVREILTMYGSYYPAPRDVDEVIALVGLDEKARARVRTLSGGQQRRLDVALGLIGDPELILDEPTTGFDPSARRQAWDLVRSMRDLGKTVLLTTHYMEEAQVLADRVIVIAAGRKVADGSPESIGGRAEADTTIRFVPPPNTVLPTLAEPVRRDADHVEIHTAHPTATLHVLTAWASDHHLELVDLSVTRPSLEDVYLQLTADADDATETA